MSVYNVTLYRETTEFVELRVEANTPEEASQAAKQKAWSQTWAILSSNLRNAVAVTMNDRGEPEAWTVPFSSE